MNTYATNASGIIDITLLRNNGMARRLAAGLIQPAKEETQVEIAPEHAAEPIKSLDDINRISEYLKENHRYRDYMLFIVGINFGLRASDLRLLRFSHLINENCTFRDTFAVFEKKTSHTRKRKKNRYITINDAVVDAVTLYLEHTPNISLSDYMFRSIAKNARHDQPITVRSIERLLKNIAAEVDLSVKVSTHTLRKTFCYHQMLMSHNDTRKLLLLQKMLNHSSPLQTLEYIGITAEEIESAYKEMNLGSTTKNYLVRSSIIESDAM